MSLPSTVNRNEYIGNGTVSVYSYGFKVFSEDDLVVIVKDLATPPVETTLTKTTDYTVTGVNNTSGGTIVLVDAAQAWLDGDGDLLTSFVIVIKRVRALTQDADLRNQGDYFPETVEIALDKNVMMAQQQQDSIDKSVKLPETLEAADFDPTLPTDIVTVSSALVTNAAGDGLEMGPTVAEISGANASAIAAAASEALAEDWANKTTDTVDGSEYSAKEYAQGVLATKGGSSKDWAQETATDVDGVGYAAKEWALGSQTRGVAASGSAKDWANHTGSTVDDTEFSAKKYSVDAAASAAAAATSAASSLWNDVSFKTFADTPIAIVDGDSGTMFAVDCTGGNVVVNLPAINVLTLSNPWSVGFKKTDTSSNTLTINRNGTDTIDGGTSYIVSRAEAGLTLIPDVDSTPDDWTSISYGEVNITGDIVGTTDTQDLSNKTFVDEITMQEITTPTTPAAGDRKIYPKSDGKMYTLDDAGVEVEVGSGGSGSGVNYVTNSTFDSNVDDVTVTVNITKTHETAAPLMGLGSLKLTLSSATTGSDTADIELDAFDTAYTDASKPIVISFLIDSSDANYSTDDVQFVLRDNTNSVDMPLINDRQGKIISTSTIQPISLSGYTVTGVTNYSLRMKSIIGRSNACDLYIDKPHVGPGSLVPGTVPGSSTKYKLATSQSFPSAITTMMNFSTLYFDDDSLWTVGASYTPATGAWGTEPHYTVPRDGKYFVSSSLLFSATTNWAKTEQAQMDFYVNGVSVGIFSTNRQYDTTSAEVFLGGSTYLNLLEGDILTIRLYQNSGSALTTVASSNLNEVVIIEKERSGAQLSTTEVSHSVYKSNHHTVTAQSMTNSALTIVDYNVLEKQTISGLVTTGATWKFTPIVTGYYLVSAGVGLNSLTVGTGEIYLTVHVKGIEKRRGPRVKIDNGFQGASISCVMHLDVGNADYFDIRLYQSNGVARNLIGTSSLNFVNIAHQPDYSSFSSLGNIEDKEIILNSGNGLGSTNTAIRRFSNVERDTGGTSLSLVQSATLGDSITINISGLYCISYIDRNSGAASVHGLSVNSSALTSNIFGITAADRIGICVGATAGDMGMVSITKRFYAGDIIRGHVDPASAPNSTASVVRFSITKIGQ